MGASRLFRLAVLLRERFHRHLRGGRKLLLPLQNIPVLLRGNIVKLAVGRFTDIDAQRHNADIPSFGLLMRNITGGVREKPYFLTHSFFPPLFCRKISRNLQMLKLMLPQCLIDHDGDRVG